MSVLKIKSKNLDLELTLDGDEPQVTGGASQTAGSAQDQTSLHAALIALALSDTIGGEVHDTESGIITIQPHVSEWSSKSYAFTNNRIK